MRIATWNVNSVKAREARVLGWLGQHRPDVLCLQELKTTDEHYPADAVRAEGYESAVFGQKAFNGVALVSPHPIREVRKGLENDDPQARLIGGVVGGITVYSAYFPNGRKVGTEAWDYKLAWIGRLLELVEERHDPGDPVVLTGDFNVAPDDLDAEDPEKWAPSVLCHPDVRRALEGLRDWGFVDVVRKHNPEGRLYSWWDYRQPRISAERRLADRPHLRHHARCRGLHRRVDRPQPAQGPQDRHPVGPCAGSGGFRAVRVASPFSRRNLGGWRRY